MDPGISIRDRYFKDSLSLANVRNKTNCLSQECRDIGESIVIRKLTQYPTIMGSLGVDNLENDKHFCEPYTELSRWVHTFIRNMDSIGRVTKSLSGNPDELN